MIETVVQQRHYQPEAARDTEDAPEAQEIARTILSLGRLAANFAKVTRIPRHADGRHENDSEHTFMLTLIAPAIAEEHYPALDLDKVERFAHIHDLPELGPGDINTFDITPEELEEKARREKEATQQLLRLLPPSLGAALIEYERQDTPEAVFVRGIDKLLPTAMGIIGDGPRVVREDFGMTSVEELAKCNNKFREERLRAITGDSFKSLEGAHVLLCAAFENLIQKQLEASVTPSIKPEQLHKVERKYLVDLDKLTQEIDITTCRSSHLKQGYLGVGDDGSETRVRGTDDETFALTVKTPEATGRAEEMITLESRSLFEALWVQTVGKRVEKTRYSIPFGPHTIELDIYEGDLTGLATAEVKFDGRVDDAKLKASIFVPPDWCCADVSEDPRYKNRNLAQTRPHDMATIYKNL